MCSKRGLLPDSDEQTFEISISQSFHNQFYKILTRLESEVQLYCMNKRMNE